MTRWNSFPGTKESRNKYSNRKVELDGHVFDSQKEARRYAELKLLEQAKEISGLRCQVKYELIPEQRDERGKLLERAVNYFADFVYYDARDKETVVEDTKGFKTKEYVLKRKLMLYVHGIKVREI